MMKNNKSLDFLITNDTSISSAISSFCGGIKNETDEFISEIDDLIEVSSFVCSTASATS